MVAPLFLTIILLVTDISTAMHGQNILTSAVREAGRYGAMDLSGTLSNGQTANSKVTEDVKNFLAAAGLPKDKITVSITSAESSSEGQPFDLSAQSNYLKMFRITASIPYNEVNSSPTQLMWGRTLSASLVFRMGRVRIVN